MYSKASKEKKASIRARYEKALGDYVEKIKHDPYVIAVVLGGSLAYYDVGEDSNLDTMIIVKDNADSATHRVFTEEGITIDSFVMKRDRFRRHLEGIIQGGQYHSFFSKAKILYTTDDSLRDYIKDSNYFGSKDREIQLLNFYSGAFYSMYKTRKFLYIVGDVYGSYSFYMQMVSCLAQIEVTLEGIIPLREVIQQALKLNPTVFNKVFIEASEMKKTEENMTEMIKACEEYLDERMEIAYKPVLDYLADVGEFRTLQEIREYLESKSGQRLPFLNLREIVRRGWVLDSVEEKRITDRSQPLLHEPSFLYDPSMVKEED
ncbi:MAG: hypothetical protein HeimAB125_05520 [Candidatus Heimdallarchaeota archaeon AB_125]|nr:MAG: hypothetical protein HeimAB125_05520 [Candidatus Heimdallarchaeota archaeon AB_125]